MNDSWLVYLNLESEILETFNYVHFCDTDSQMNTYSRKFAELLLRTCIEIETLSKEVYNQNGGTKKKNPRFDTDCIKYLDDVFKIKNKVVNISYPYFDCKDPKNKRLIPLSDFCLSDGCEWQKSYQSIKHDRLKNVKKATMKSVIHSLAALYLLNIYYKNEKFVVHFNDITNYDTRFGSSLFSLDPPISKHDILYCPENDGAVYEIKMEPNSQKKSKELIEKYRERIRKYIGEQPESLDKDFMAKFAAKEHSTLLDFISDYVTSLFNHRINKEMDGLSLYNKIDTLKNKYILNKIDGYDLINPDNFEEMKNKYLATITMPIIRSFEPPNTIFNLYEALYDLIIIKSGNC